MDLISPKIPEEIKIASIDFAKTHPELGLDPEAWMNNGLESILTNLPQGRDLDLQEICKEWVLAGDTNPLWPIRVETVLNRLLRELGYE